MTTFTMPTPPDFKYMPTIWSHGWYQLAPFSFDEASKRLTRIQQLRDGTVVKFSLVPEHGDRSLAVTVEGGDLNPAQREEIQAVIGRILGFDQEVAAFYAWLRNKPRYAWVERAGAGRIMVSPSVWEDLAKTLLTTNTTWAMTKNMVMRLCSLGRPFGEGFAFPTPQTVADLPPDEFAEKVRAGYRAAYLHELARKIADGLDVEAWYQDGAKGAELYKRVRSLKGFGDYAAGATLRLMQRHDYLSLDSACRDMYQKQINGGQAASDAEIRAYYEPFGEWRGLAQWMDLLATWFEQP